jgi:hypothetical protein
MAGSGTKDDPWQLKTPPGSSEDTMYREWTVEAWARDESNPAGGNNRMRAL